MRLLSTKFLTHICIPALLSVAAPARAQSLYVNNFDLDTTAAWTVNKSTGANANDTGSSANFFFDYSTIGISSAPNSVGGTTRGLQMRANMTGGIFSGLSVSPTGLTFSGDYTLRFDMWINYNGTLAGGGSGSTQVTGAGIGTAGTSAQWAGFADSIHFGVTGDGGSTVDYRAYSSAATSGYPDASPVFAAGAHAGNRNNTDPYYTKWGNATAPAAQLALFPQQTNSTAVGAQGFSWRDVTIAKSGNNVTYSIDGTAIATVDASTVTLAGSNILFNYYDINATSSTDPNAGALLFGLIDNVRVTAVPEPSSYLLGLLGGAIFWFARRRR
jgi:hypothetical protein